MHVLPQALPLLHCLQQPLESIQAVQSALHVVMSPDGGAEARSALLVPNLGFDARIVNACDLQEIARRGGSKWYSAGRSQERHQRNDVQHIR